MYITEVVTLGIAPEMKTHLDLIGLLIDDAMLAKKMVSEVGFEPTPPFGDQNTQPNWSEGLSLSLAP